MFSIEITKTAKRFLKKLNKKESEKVLNKIYSIRNKPYRHLKKLKGEKLWGLRIGDYGAIADVVVKMNKIIILRTGHKKHLR